MTKEQALIFELSHPGRVAYDLPEVDVPAMEIPKEWLREQPPELPEVSELDVIRHYTALSRKNIGVDQCFYPLGSCTMKYNPKINEEVARFAGFTSIHPYQPEKTVQGALQVIGELQRDLAAITGMDQFSLQPAAGAQGEWTGLMMIRAYHEQRGEGRRNQVIIPDTAHGTNPASATVAGLETITIPSNEKGHVDIEELKNVLGSHTAALMLTNPNTLGLFEEQIEAIASLVHQAGGLLYYDGANANAILGKVRPGDMGFDVVHLNLHKTFTTPHGGGGPGAGPVGVKKQLIPFLPAPIVAQDSDGLYRLHNPSHSIGRVKAFYGNFLILVRAYTYIRTMGPAGLRQVSEDAVLHANYLMKRLSPYFELPYPRRCKHEFVLSGKRQKKKGVRVLDIAKRLLDFHVHPPTIYFPLIVEECLMIEPTETESKETLDRFIEIMIQIAKEVEENPELVRQAPHQTHLKRLDEVRAARKPVLKWEKDEEQS